MKVLIIGGGVIGCSTAYHLAKNGVDVTVIERGKAGQEASSVAAGILTVATDKPVFDALTVLSVKSLSIFPEFVRAIEGASSVQSYYRPASIIRLAPTAEAAKELTKSKEFCRLAGVETKWLSTDSEVGKVEPGLKFTGFGALLAPNEAQIHSGLYTQALYKAAKAAGAKFLENSGISGIEQKNFKITGVRLGTEKLEADTVIVAAGSWTSEILRLLSIEMAVEPVRGQIMIGAVKTKPLSHIIYSGSNYLCLRPNGQFLVGTTFEKAGFDRKVNQLANKELSTWSCSLLPAICGVPFKETILNFRPVTADEKPVMGPVPGFNGLWVCSGHYRKGIILSPLAGKLTAEAVLAGQAPEEFKPFAVARLLASKA